jgi:hypothetical protein
MAGEQPRALIRPLLCDMPLRMFVVPCWWHMYLFESGTNIPVLFQASCQSGEAQKIQFKQRSRIRAAVKDASSRFNLRKI